MTHTAPCPIYGACGGCTLQHLDWDAYHAHKTAHLIAPLTAAGIPLETMSPLHILKGPLRRRTVLKATRAGRETHIGFYAPKSHQVVDMPTCLVLRPSLVALLAPLRQLLTPFLRPKKEMHIALLDTDQGIDVAFVDKDLPPLTLDDRERLTGFAHAQNLARLRWGEDPLLVQRTPSLDFAGVRVAADALAFAQASDEADAFLTQTVLDHVLEGTQTALDLFCGRGLFTFALLQKAKKVTAIDSDARAVSALKVAARPFLTRVTPVVQDLFRVPVQARDMDMDLVLLDPPRAGAPAQVKEIAKARPKRVIYISCNPSTFAKDAGHLLRAGYSVRFLQGLDQFLWSNHLELIAVFDV